MSNYAPVLICTLNRYEHFKKCIESLMACKGSHKTDLFIGFDYPLHEKHSDGYEKIKSYLPSISGFKSINITYREQNWGINDNWENMINYVFEEHDRLIISEDDNTFSNSFLDFVNQGLEVYFNREDIFSISGYNYPFKVPTWLKHDAYLAPAFSGWGVGVWRSKYNKVDWSLERFNKLLNQNYKLIKNNYELWLPNLLEIRDKQVSKGDGILLMHMIEHKMYSLFPTNTKVINWGHDGTGENGGYNDLYRNQKLIEESKQMIFSKDLMPDPRMLNYFSKQLKIPLKEKIKATIPSSMKLLLKTIIR